MLYDVRKHLYKFFGFNNSGIKYFIKYKINSDINYIFHKFNIMKVMEQIIIVNPIIVFAANFWVLKNESK